MSDNLQLITIIAVTTALVATLGTIITSVSLRRRIARLRRSCSDGYRYRVELMINDDDMVELIYKDCHESYSQYRKLLRKFGYDKVDWDILTPAESEQLN